jgi:uracil DNA glycosylase
MSQSIRLSEKHGVNPAIPLCFFCLKSKNELILAGKMKNDQEAPKNMVWDKRPCTECEGWMKQGIILISVDESKTEDNENPYRSGGWAVVKDDLIKRVLEKSPELLEDILRKRVAFMPDEAWDIIGLPRGEMQDGQSEPVPTNG